MYTPCRLSYSSVQKLASINQQLVVSKREKRALEWRGRENHWTETGERGDRRGVEADYLQNCRVVAENKATRTVRRYFGLNIRRRRRSPIDGHAISWTCHHPNWPRATRMVKGERRGQTRRGDAAAASTRVPGRKKASPMGKDGTSRAPTSPEIACRHG